MAPNPDTLGQLQPVRLWRIVNVPASSSLPTLAGVPTATETLVFFR